MSLKPTKAMTAAELIAQLQSDPKWVRQNAERESKRKATEEEIRAEETPLIADLKTAGVDVSSVWDLVNSRSSYPAAISVLSKHLQRPYRREIREGIARALTVAEARGPVARVILTELRRPPKQSPRAVRWALANALTVAADSGMADDIRKLIIDPCYEDVRKPLKLALKNLTRN